jgi:hypothetical protein
MRRLTTVFAAVILLCLAAVPGVAQAQVRAPAVISASVNDLGELAHPFHPSAQIIVTSVETAGIEASEPAHSCTAPADTGMHSVWFRTALAPGTLTLDTTGTSYDGGATTSPNSVISIYRGQPSFSFATLSPVACSDNGFGAGIINGADIAYLGYYYIQISAAPGVNAVDPSQVMLTATYVPDHPIINDEPDGAKKLKTPGLPTVVGINSATTALNEPVDPLASGVLTNTVWFRFTMNTRRAASFVNLLSFVSIRFSVFTRSGDTFTPAAGVVQSVGNQLIGIFEAGEYYLRAGIENDPSGTSTGFISIANIAVLSPANYEFAAGLTEGAIGALPSLDGWTVANGSAGEVVACDAGTHDCYFQFISGGAGENTQLKGKIALRDVRLKRGDALAIQLEFFNPTGAPNLKATLKLVDAAGAVQKYSLNVSDPLATFPGQIFRVAQTFTPVKAIITITNNDTVFGHVVQIDGVAVQALRLGEGVRTLLPVPPAAQ